MRLESSGFKKAAERLKKFGEKYKREQISAIQDVSIKIVGEAKTLVPIISGNLKRSINFDHPKVQGKQIVGKVGSAAGYSHFVEYGSDRFSVNFAGRYYLQRAIKSTSGYMRDRMRRVLKDAIVKI